MLSLEIHFLVIKPTSQLCEIYSHKREPTLLSLESHFLVIIILLHILSNIQVNLGHLLQSCFFNYLIKKKEETVQFVSITLNITSLNICMASMIGTTIITALFGTVWIVTNYNVIELHVTEQDGHWPDTRPDRNKHIHHNA